MTQETAEQRQREGERAPSVKGFRRPERTLDFIFRELLQMQALRKTYLDGGVFFIFISLLFLLVSKRGCYVFQVMEEKSFPVRSSEGALSFRVRICE